jgi:hypothetical protein
VKKASSSVSRVTAGSLPHGVRVRDGQRVGATLIRRVHRASPMVHPGTFTFNHRRVGPAVYALASSFAT